MTSSSAEDQPAPSTGQPGVDPIGRVRAAQHARHSIHGPQPGQEFVRTAAFLIARADIDTLLDEIDSLRRQLAAAQVERDNLGQHLRTEWNVIDQLRAQVVELRQRASDYEAAEGTAIVQRNAALNEALAYKFQAEAMRAVVEAAKGMMWRFRDLHRDDMHPEEQTLLDALAALDAASAGQPATSSNRRQTSPSANDSPIEAQPEVCNAGPSESRLGTFVEGKVVHYFTPRFSNLTLCAACDCTLGNPWHANATEVPGR